MTAFDDIPTIRDCEIIIEDWIAKNKTKSRRSKYEIYVDYDRNIKIGKFEVNEGWADVDGELFGNYIGMRVSTDPDDKNLPWIVTHIPTGLSFGDGFSSRRKAIRFVQGIINLGKWNWKDVSNFHELSAAVRGLHTYCSIRGVPCEQLQAIIDQINKQKTT